MGRDFGKGCSPIVLHEVFRGLDVCVQPTTPPNSQDIRPPPFLRELTLEYLEYAPTLLRVSVCGPVTRLTLQLPFLMSLFGFDAALSAILLLCPTCKVLALRDALLCNGGQRWFVEDLRKKAAPAGIEVVTGQVEHRTLETTRAQWHPEFTFVSRTWRMPELRTLVADSFPSRREDITSFISGLIAAKLVKLSIRELKLSLYDGPPAVSTSDDSLTPPFSLAAPKWENLSTLTFHTAMPTCELWPMMRGLTQLRSLDYSNRTSNNADMLVTKLSNVDPEFGGWGLPSLQLLALAVVPLILPVTAMILNRR